MAAEAFIERVTFAGGELGRALAARSDLGRYQVALAAMENYVTMVEGGATRRSGTAFVLELKDSTQAGRLIPFRIQLVHYVLVINAGVSRIVHANAFVTNPDTSIFEFAVPWAAADLPNIRTVNNENLIYACDGVRVTQVTYTSPLVWTAAAFATTGGPVDTQNLDVTKTIQASAQTGAVNLTGIGTAFTAGQIGQQYRLDDRDLSLTPEWTTTETAIATGQLRRWNGNVYSAVGGPLDAGPNPPVHTSGDVSAGQGKIIWRFEHPGYGFVQILTVTNALTATGTVLSKLPATVVSGATYRWSPPAWSADVGFPTGIAFSKSRLLLTRGSYFWLAGVGVPSNMLVSGQDDDAIAGRLKSPDGSQVDIQWALHTGVLILGTSDIEWSLRGTTPFAGLTPGTITPVPDNTDGSIAGQVPAGVDGGVIYIGKSGKRLHFAKFDLNDTNSQRVSSDEISVTARHIIVSGVQAIAWQRDPQRVLWIVLKDGTLAALTFMPKQQIIAFHRHPMANAFVEDTTVIPSTGTGLDQVYFIVRRTINGATKRYVERLQEYFAPVNPDPAAATAIGAWFLDCALRYQGAPATVIAGLGYLEGQVVGVFADGGMQTRKTVVGGSITLDRAASDVLVGLPIVARLQDLPRNLNSQAGPTDGQDKTISEGYLNVLYCGGGVLSVNDGPGENIIETGQDNYGAPPPLFTGDKRIPIEGELRVEAQMQLINDDAMPCTVLGMSPRLRVEED